MENYTFRKASAADAGAIMEIIDFARHKMLDEGRRQWDEHYPALRDIMADIDHGHGYVICRAGRIAAYGAICFDGEPAYGDIDGQWQSNADEPYMVVHRLAVAGGERRQGLGSLFLQQAWQLMLRQGIRSFRIDTNFDNDAMLGVLEKMGFSYCGEIHYGRGTRRAYEKVV